MSVFWVREFGSTYGYLITEGGTVIAKNVTLTEACEIVAPEGVRVRI